MNWLVQSLQTAVLLRAGKCEAGVDAVATHVSLLVNSRSL